jgi:hypothetical protein
MIDLRKPDEASVRRNRQAKAMLSRTMALLGFVAMLSLLQSPFTKEGKMFVD